MWLGPYCSPDCEGMWCCSTNPRGDGGITATVVHEGETRRNLTGLPGTEEGLGSKAKVVAADVSIMHRRAEQQEKGEERQLMIKNCTAGATEKLSQCTQHEAGIHTLRMCRSKCNQVSVALYVVHEQ